MALTPTVAVDCCLKDDGLRLFLGLSSNNTLCVFFHVITIIIIIMTTISPYSFDKYG